VRTRLAIAFVLLSIASANAQQQDKKLLDRLLKPDASLQLNVQDKQFVAGGAVLTKKARTKPFFVSQRSWEKQYGGTKEFQAKEFAAAQSRFASRQADTSSRNKLTKIDSPYSTTAYVTRDAIDAAKKVDTADYPGARPFLLRGKSQKSLSAQDRQLTIDEVRELLNKNK